MQGGGRRDGTTVERRVMWFGRVFTPQQLRFALESPCGLPRPEESRAERATTRLDMEVTPFLPEDAFVIVESVTAIRRPAA